MSNNPQRKQDESLAQKAIHDTYVSFGQQITHPTKQGEATDERKDETTDKVKWFPYFKDSSNLFPNYVAWLALNSPTNRAILASKKTLAKGKLVIVYNNEIVDDFETLPTQEREFCKNPSGEFLYDINDYWSDLIDSWIDMGAVWPKMKRAKVGNEIAWKAKVIDYTKPRLLKGEKPRAIVSPYWRLIKNQDSAQELKTASKYDVWDGAGNPPEEFLLHVRRREPSYDYYGVPDYWACSKDAMAEYLIDTFNKNQLEDGFMPRSFITYIKQFTGDDEESPESYLKKQYDLHKGAHNGGKTRLSVVSDREAAPIINELNSAKEGEFLTLEESATRGIIRAHRWFPALAGMETAGRLGGNQDLLNQWNIAMKNVAKPDYQEPMLRLLNKQFEIMGLKIKADVINEPPIGLEDQLTVDDFVTMNEGREMLGKDGLDPDDDGNMIEVDGALSYIGDMPMVKVKELFRTTARNRNNGA